MSIPDQKIHAVARVLGAWNPAAESSADLDGYRTEAIDILAELDAEKTAAKIVQQVISQAFEFNQTAQRTGASRFAQKQIQRPRRLAFRR